MTEAKLPYVMKNTSTNSRKDDRLATPDLCLYPIDDYAKQAYTDAKSGYHDSKISKATADRVDSGLTDGIAKKHAADREIKLSLRGPGLSSFSRSRWTLAGNPSQTRRMAN